MAGDIGNASGMTRPNGLVNAPTRALTTRTDRAGSGSSADPSFREILADSIQQVNVRQQEADRAIEALTTGETTNLAEVMSAVEKADLAFRTLMQFRNKLVSAYQEINNLRY